MNTSEIKELIEEYKTLFWYIPENQKENISNELLIETILNYGDMNAVQKLFPVMGVKNVARIFGGLQGRKVLNYYPEIYNLFHFTSRNMHKIHLHNLFSIKKTYICT